MNQRSNADHVLAVGAELPPLTLGSETESSTTTNPKGRRTKKTAERFESINHFVDFTMRELTPSERTVWLILWRDTKPDGLAQTSQKSLADRAGISDRQVRTALTSLKVKGLVKVVNKGRLGQGPSTYRIYTQPG